MKISNANSKVWLITGVSSGLGREIAKVAAEHDDIVIGTLRKESQFQAFYDLVPGHTQPIQMDVTVSEQIDEVVEKVIRDYGRIDVLVNNAGFGLIGAAEELSDAEARAQFETNFWGAVNLTKAVLPHMRERQEGRIIQISAIGGFAPFPGMSVYGASKIALEGFSDSLAAEVAPFGIKVSSILPGPMRTEWAGSSLQTAKRSIAAYDSSVGKFKNFLASIDGKQPWSPYKTAGVIYEAALSEEIPSRLFIGDMAVEHADKKITQLQNDLSNWREQALSTKFDEVTEPSH